MSGSFNFPTTKVKAYLLNFRSHRIKASIPDRLHKCEATSEMQRGWWSLWPHLKSTCLSKGIPYHVCSLGANAVLSKPKTRVGPGFGVSSNSLVYLLSFFLHLQFLDFCALISFSGTPAVLPLTPNLWSFQPAAC